MVIGVKMRKTAFLLSVELREEWAKQIPRQVMPFGLIASDPITRLESEPAAKDSFAKYQI